MFPFSQKNSESERAYVPVNIVQKLAAQGIPEPEIMRRLQSQGFSGEQVQTALRMVLKDRVTGPREVPRELKEQSPSMQMFGKETAQPMTLPTRRPPEEATMQQSNQQMMDSNQQMRESNQQMQISNRQMKESNQQMQPHQEEQTYTFEEPEKRFAPEMEDVTLEEVIEGIVADRWQAFEERLSNFEERDMQLQAELQELRGLLKETEKKMSNKEEDLGGRFDELGGSMTEIQGRIGSIEKVFKEFMPELSKNVRIISEASENK